jgi:peroxiredoxin
MSAAGEDFGMMRRVAVAVVMVVVVCLLFWAGWHNLRSRRVAMQQAQQAQVTVTQSGVEPQGTHQGKPAPAFTLLDMTGKKVSLADYKGRPVVVNFWATWCGPCQLEMPWLEEFHTKYKGQGLEVLGISDDPDQPKDAILKTSIKLGVTYPLLLPDATVKDSYGVADYWPTSFFVDKNGVVVVEKIGAPSKDEMEADIRKAMGQ